MQDKCHHDVLLYQGVQSILCHCSLRKLQGFHMAYDSRGRHWRCFIICLHSSKCNWISLYSSLWSSSPTHVSFLQTPESQLYHLTFGHAAASLWISLLILHKHLHGNPTQPRGYPSHSTSSQKSSLNTPASTDPSLFWHLAKPSLDHSLSKTSWEEGWMKPINCLYHSYLFLITPDLTRLIISSIKLSSFIYIAHCRQIRT